MYLHPHKFPLNIQLLVQQKRANMMHIFWLTDAEVSWSFLKEWIDDLLWFSLLYC